MMNWVWGGMPPILEIGLIGSSALPRKNMMLFCENEKRFGACFSACKHLTGGYSPLSPPPPGYVPDDVMSGQR